MFKGEGRLLNSLVHISLVHPNAFLSCTCLACAPKCIPMALFVFKSPQSMVPTGLSRESRSGKPVSRPSSLYKRDLYKEATTRFFGVRCSDKTLLSSLFQGGAGRRTSSESGFLAHCSSVHRPWPVEWLFQTDFSTTPVAALEMTGCIRTVTNSPGRCLSGDS